ncbi:hypothetical protein [Terrisporobacter mayombei]|uniref:Lipoprotein n=1 Tax=Terrisporobacter mayombei TaxID=1541 RepID=A0ABY9PYZ8_9FIRM|nr:hypothetical protein [Terrisporobacter mayombei]MCC3866691.1 hypothetical protein [Terrisporobacter mayombei]WMT80928.1 hypothetical protein TEMA_12520 [Terrisporobacter mayombei]
MKISKNAIIIMCVSSILLMGCRNKSKNDEKSTDSKSLEYTEEITVDNSNTSDIENHIPYVDASSGEIDNSVINRRYENVKKEELTYNSSEKTTENEVIVYPAESIKNDVFYKSILEGFTYFSEGSPINLTYDEAIKLVKKVLPDDIEKVDYVLDKEVNKEYIYYKSDQGNFRVWLSYGGEFKNDDLEDIHKNSVLGIDYSKEI